MQLFVGTIVCIENVSLLNEPKIEDLGLVLSIS
jgi:hypothetical protein